MATYTVAITGASGAPYALRLLEVLVKGGHKIYLSMTGEGLSIMKDETGLMLKGSETDIMFALEKRLEFQRQRIAHALRQHEIHETFHDTNLTGGLKPKDILAERGEQVFGGGFGLGAVFQVEQILLNRRVGRGLALVGRERQKIHALLAREGLKRNENVVWFHERPVC